MRVWPWHSGKTGLQPKTGLPRPRGSVTLSESLRRLGQLPLQGVGRKDVALPTSPRLAAAVGSGVEAPCGPAALPPGARAATPGPGGTAGGSHALRGEGHSRQVRLLLILRPKRWAGAAPAAAQWDAPPRVLPGPGDLRPALPGPLLAGASVTTTYDRPTMPQARRAPLPFPPRVLPRVAPLGGTRTCRFRPRGNTASRRRPSPAAPGQRCMFVE